MSAPVRPADGAPLPAPGRSPYGGGMPPSPLTAPAPSADGGDVLARVRAELDAVFDARPLGGSAPASFDLLWDRLRAHTAGGKLVRPRLVDLGWRTAASRADPAEAARLGAALELLHVALLVHDDVIDRDELRRGRPTLAEEYRRDLAAAGVPAGEDLHLGRSVAVIAGDVLLTEAFRLAVACTPDPVRAGRVSAVVFQAATAAAAGELEDVMLSLHRHTGEHPGPERILDMERLKTASYSFEAPLRAGALLGGAAPEHAAALAEAGALLGVAYQVVDDVLGLAGDPAVTGKAAGADLREGKATLLTAHGRRDPAVRAALEALARAERSGAGLAALSAAVGRARAALLAAGAVEHAAATAQALVDRARTLLDSLPLAPAVRDEFAATCHHVLHRES